jgi:hypothetical protein
MKLEEKIYNKTPLQAKKLYHIKKKSEIRYEDKR